MEKTADDLKFDTAVKRLKAFYSKYGDAYTRDISAIDSFVKDRENTKLLITFKANPYWEKLLNLITVRYDAICKRQLGREKRSDLQQDLDNLDKDWCLIFIRAIGGDPKRVLEAQTIEIESELKKAGLPTS